MAGQDVNWQDVLSLASLLRENGDRVLNGCSKLRLSPSLLMKLNAAFMHISVVGCGDNFQVTSAHASQPLSTSQLHFLHDFVQKTVGLAISGCAIGYQDPSKKTVIDLNRFRSLRHLELKSCIPMNCAHANDMVRGLRGLRMQLETLVLMHIINVHDLLWNILANGEVTIASDIMWSRLSQLVISYCGIQSLDNGLLLTNNLQWLDASHNRLADSEAIGSSLAALPRLRYLNLSYNRLTRVPMLFCGSSTSTPKYLRFLLLSHNHIDNLQGLECLISLTELNLTGNQLHDHNSLHPLRALFQLQHLKLDSNPITFLKNYRGLIAQYLSPRAILMHRFRRGTIKPSPFLLDGRELSEQEKKAVCHGPNSSILITRNEAPTISLDSGSVESPLSEIEKSSKRSRKVRPVSIADFKDVERETEDSIDRNAMDSIENSGEHLQTKEQIENMRKRYGQNWLLAQSGSTAVQEMLNFQSPSMVEGEESNERNGTGASPSIYSSTPCKPSPLTGHIDVHLEVLENLVLKMPLGQASNGAYESQNAVGISDSSALQLSQSTKYSTANESDSVLQVTACEQSNEPQKHASYDADDEEEENIADQDDNDELEISDDSKFAVQEVIAGHCMDEVLFLIITPRFIKEVKPSTAQTRQRWPLKVLDSCVMLSVNPCRVQLSFTTIVQSKRHRVYQMDLTEAQKQLLPSLESILEARSFSAMNFAAFRCMSCSSEFSADLSPKKASQKCYTCGSAMVFQLDEVPLPTLGGMPVQRSQTPVENATIPACSSESTLLHSPSDSSIGSAASLESPSNTVSKSNEATPFPATNLRRCESDIDIISNPSQSSIEILDDVSRASGTPGRKRSSEERQVVAVPSLHPVPECTSSLTPLPAGLTESSSSGSLTESVCTAYENNTGVSLSSTISKAPHGIAGTPLTEETSREASPRFEGDPHSSERLSQSPSLSNVLDGLLQTMSSKISASESTERRIKKKTSNSEVFVQYDNIDFSSVDHRLKLHLHFSILDREVIQLLLRGEVVCLTPENRYPGILVITSHKVYVIEIVGPEEGDRIDKWVSCVRTLPRSSLQSVAALPWGFGVLISLKTSSSLVNILMVLRDQQYSENFFSFLESMPPDESWKIDKSPSENHCSIVNGVFADLIRQSCPADTDFSLALAVLLCACYMEHNEDKQNILGGILLVTSDSLFVCNDDLSWLFLSSKDVALKCIAKQPISNLIEVDSQGLNLMLQFLDETAGVHDLWKLTLQSESVKSQIVSAVSNPWEELFSVPLQVNLV